MTSIYFSYCRFIGIVFSALQENQLMKRYLMLLIIAGTFGISCNSPDGPNADRFGKVRDLKGTTASAPPTPSLDSNVGNTGAQAGNLKSIIDSNMIRMSRLELTNHPAKDFALFMRVHHVGAKHLIGAALKQRNLDTALAGIARDIEKDITSENVMLNRFIIDSRFNKRQQESAVSNNLMKSMTPNNQPSMPMSGNVSDDFAMLMITSLQTANDMVEVMKDGGADYDISGFTEEMVPSNEKHIEKLKNWTMKK